MKYIMAIFGLLILAVGCAPATQDLATPKGPPEIFLPESRITQPKQSIPANITPAIPYKPRSTVPVIPEDHFMVFQGYPPTGKYPATSKNWLDESFRRSPNYGLIYLASTDIAPIHYNTGSGMMINDLQIYKDFGVRLLTGDYMVPTDYFNHNLPYTLWSEKEGWYIPTVSPASFGGLLYYLSRYPPADMNYDKPPQPYYRWYEVTEADIQEWRIQELESEVDQLRQQQYR